MRAIEKDRRDGYGQGFADARGFAGKMRRQRADLERLAGVASFPGAWLEGYEDGHSKGLVTTLRVQVEGLRDAA